MKIVLTDGYFVEKKGRDCVLKKSYIAKGKNGEYDAEKRIGYFSNIENAISRYLEEIQAKEIGAASIDIKNYVDAIREINNDAVNQITASLTKQ